MTLYHCSNIAVQFPHLLKIQRALDFGKGFYTTSDFEQARKWTERTTRIRQFLPQMLKDQYTFKTEKALSLLRFIEVKEA